VLVAGARLMATRRRIAVCSVLPLALLHTGKLVQAKHTLLADKNPPHDCICWHDVRLTSTVASTSPRTAVDPILQLSPLYMVTGRDSPVRADWSTSRRPSLIRQSEQNRSSRSTHQKRNVSPLDAHADKAPSVC
jgi:hypothetical protein